MSKTILGEIDGFTPIIDDMAKEYGVIAAVVFSLIWRKCQLKDGLCWASHSTLGDLVGINRQTVCEHANKLVADGFLEIVERLPNGIVVYKDTGKAGLSFQVTGGVGANYKGCRPETQVAVGDTDLKILTKDTNYDTKEDTIRFQKSKAKVVVKSEKKLRDELISRFKHKTQLDFPEDVPHSTIQKFWWSPATDMIELAGGVDQAWDILVSIIDKFDDKGFVYADPNSFLKTFKATVAQQKRGVSAGQPKQFRPTNPDDEFYDVVKR